MSRGEGSRNREELAGAAMILASASPIQLGAALALVGSLVLRDLPEGG